MIYFIQSSDKSIKIGFTNQNPLARLKALQTGSNLELTLLGVINGDKNRELRLHDRFKEFRIRGEWFKNSKELVNFINENALPNIARSQESNVDELEICIGNSIKTLRIQKNMHRDTVCELAGISMNALRHLETGKGANIKTLVRVARVLGKQDWVMGLAPQISINPLNMVGGKPRQRARKS